MKFYSTQLNRLRAIRFPKKRLQPKASTIEFLKNFARTYNPQVATVNHGDEELS